MIQAHAEVVSKFVKDGFDEAHKNHPVPTKARQEGLRRKSTPTPKRQAWKPSSSPPHSCGLVVLQMWVLPKMWHQHVNVRVVRARSRSNTSKRLPPPRPPPVIDDRPYHTPFTRGARAWGAEIVVIVTVSLAGLGLFLAWMVGAFHHKVHPGSEPVEKATAAGRTFGRRGTEDRSRDDDRRRIGATPPTDDRGEPKLLASIREIKPRPVME